jgi:hypothetical protein
MRRRRATTTRPYSRAESSSRNRKGRSDDDTLEGKLASLNNVANAFYAEHGALEKGQEARSPSCARRLGKAQKVLVDLPPGESPAGPPETEPPASPLRGLGGMLARSSAMGGRVGNGIRGGVTPVAFPSGSWHRDVPQDDPQAERTRGSRQKRTLTHAPSATTRSPHNSRLSSQSNGTISA